MSFDSIEAELAQIETSYDYDEYSEPFRTTQQYAQLLISGQAASPVATPQRSTPVQSSRS
jgi:hypothetical protein